jgi:hypothetical protein
MLFSLSSQRPVFACGIRATINTVSERSHTNFFDWLTCSIQSINEIIEGKKIEFSDCYEFYPDNQIVGVFKNFHLLRSSHDFHNVDNNTIIEVTEKYNRRYIRMIETLKTHNNIHFLRHCYSQEQLEEKEILKFYDNLNRINKDLTFSFILIFINDNTEYNDIHIPDTLLEKKNFHYVDLKKFTEFDITEELEWHKFLKPYKNFLKI